MEISSDHSTDRSRDTTTFQTSDILKYHANTTAHTMLQGNPDLVVVDSSLWDLAVWKERVQCGSRPCDGQSGWPCALPCGSRRCSGECGSGACTCNRSRTVSRQRVQQWCKHDLPGLLERVQRAFPTSRIAFRTAPTIIDTKAERHEWFTSHDIELLYECVTSSTEKGKLFGKYEIIDYRAIVKELADQHAPGLYRYDGYHPNWYASTMYVHKVLRSLGVQPLDPELPHGANLPSSVMDGSVMDGAPELLIDGGRRYDDDDDDFAATAADNDADSDDS